MPRIKKTSINNKIKKGNGASKPKPKSTSTFSSPTMNKKEFILILVALIFLSGGYYLSANNIWPFSDSIQSDPAFLDSQYPDEVYAVNGVVKEIYPTVIILQTTGGNELGELAAVINQSTEVFTYKPEVNGSYTRVSISLNDIEVGDEISLTSNEDIKKSVNKVFVASSIAAYNK